MTDIGQGLIQRMTAYGDDLNRPLLADSGQRTADADRLQPLLCRLQFRPDYSQGRGRRLLCSSPTFISPCSGAA